jgi:hypothetical protein
MSLWGQILAALAAIATILTPILSLAFHTHKQLVIHTERLDRIEKDAAEREDRLHEDMEKLRETVSHDLETMSDKFEATMTICRESCAVIATALHQPSVPQGIIAIPDDIRRMAQR